MPELETDSILYSVHRCPRKEMMRTHAYSKGSKTARSLSSSQARFSQVRSSPFLQPKLTLGQSNDPSEAEADRVAGQVMRMPNPSLHPQWSIASPSVQRLCSQCEDKVQRQPEKSENDEEQKEPLQMKSESEGTSALTPDLQAQITELQQTGGQPLDPEVRDFFEPRFGHSFSQVKVHHDEHSAAIAHKINARAFTIGQNIVFNAGEYEPRSTQGQHLLAHELTHVIQQGQASQQPAQSSTAQSSHVQRTLGDGHDLTSPRFSKLLDLEAAYDDESILREGSSGRGVQAIQQALYDLGIRLPNFGADGDFGRETKTAVKAFQRRNPPLVDDGEVGPLTMAALDARFPTPTLPPAATLAAPWDKACVRSVLCPWSPHTIDVLRTRITLKSFDDIFWTDERWDGAAWVPDIFPGGGYNTGTEIGVLNSSCEEMSETLYHEVLHAEQPRTHRTTQARESYAYRIGEEFSIAMGLGGRASLRSTDAEGREFADRTKVDAFVASEYPSVAAGGGGEEIIGKAATLGHVIVRRPSGSTYTRPAVVGEKVPGPITLVNEVSHPRTGWTCP